jgi:hypothetical protein
VILDVFGIALDRFGDGGALQFRGRNNGCGENSVANGGEFGLLRSGLVGGLKAIRPDRFAVTLASIPPLDEVAALGRISSFSCTRT